MVGSDAGLTPEQATPFAPDGSGRIASDSEVYTGTSQFPRNTNKTSDGGDDTGLSAQRFA